IEVGERQRERGRISARKTRAAEHQSNAVMKYVGRDPAPQQLHGGALAIGRVNAGTAQLKNFAGMSDERRDVVLGCRIEATQPDGRLSPEQPVSSDDRVLSAPAGVVKDQEMIAIVVEAIHIAAPLPHMRQRARSQRLVKDPVAKRLRSIDVGGG